jgi:hypothetical protein
VFPKPFELAMGTTQTPVQQVLECEADRWPPFVTELKLPGDVPLFFDMSTCRAEGNLDIHFKEDNLKFRIAFFCRQGLVHSGVYFATYTSALHHLDAL